MILHVMPDFVGDDVSLGEVATDVELALEFVIEREIDVDLLIERAIERPHRGLAGAAGRARDAANKYERRIGVVLPKLLKTDVHTSSVSASTLADERLLSIFACRLVLRRTRKTWMLDGERSA